MERTENLLNGGNVAAFVVKIGDTVRKPATAATPAIEQLLLHLQAVGFSAAPRTFGCDEQGRHVLEYIPGVPCRPGPPLSLTGLERVGTTIRNLHDAVSSFQPPASAAWNVLMPPDGNEIICHNDLAPWNLVRDGERWVFIDWDTAAPGTRLWDLAYAALTFPPIDPGCDLQEAATRVGAILNGYGLERSRSFDLLQLMVKRARAMYELLAAGNATGQQPWARLYAEGHGKYWKNTADSIELHLPSLAAQLAVSL